MSKTLTVAVGGEGFEQAIKYINRRGVPIPPMKADESYKLSVEIRDVPQIISIIEEAGYFKGGLDNSLPLVAISDGGLTLYFVTHSGMSENRAVRWREGYVFIPMDNVITIHNITSEFVDNLAEGNF
jgi:hypothetical protein